MIVEADGWGFGQSILDENTLQIIQSVLEQSPIIVEHWFYRGSRSPDRLVFDDFDAFREYLDHSARPGDAIHIWRFDVLCRDDNELAYGKYPDSKGRVPKHGAY